MAVETGHEETHREGTKFFHLPNIPKMISCSFLQPNRMTPALGLLETVPLQYRCAREQLAPANSKWPFLPAWISTVTPPLNRIISRMKALAGMAGRIPGWPLACTSHIVLGTANVVGFKPESSLSHGSVNSKVRTLYR